MLGTDLGLTATRQAGAWWPANACFMADFVGNRYMSEGSPIPAASAFSFSRATSKMAAGSTGIWTSFAPNVPALTDRGLSIEAGSTNLLPNAALAGGTPATYTAIGNAGLPTGLFIRNIPGGVSADISYTTDSGLPCMDIRLYGTATNNTPFVLTFSPNNAVPATLGQRLLTSLFLSSRAGIIPSSVTVRVFEYDASATNTLTADSGSLDVVSSSLNRFFADYLVVGSATVSCPTGLRLGVGTGITTNFTLRLAAFQNEISTLLPSSPILTNGSSANRGADSLSLSLPTGTESVRYTFDDGSTQTVSAAPGVMAVPTNLPREWITGVVALAA